MAEEDEKDQEMKLKKIKKMTDEEVNEDEELKKIKKMMTMKSINH